jgi:hypothetical protein
VIEFIDLLLFCQGLDLSNLLYSLPFFRYFRKNEKKWGLAPFFAHFSASAPQSSACGIPIFWIEIQFFGLRKEGIF